MELLIKSFHILKHCIPLYESSLHKKFTIQIQGKCKKINSCILTLPLAIIQKSLTKRSNGYSFCYLMLQHMIMMITILICSHYMFIFACLLNVWSRISKQIITLVNFIAFILHFFSKWNMYNLTQIRVIYFQVAE